MSLNFQFSPSAKKDLEDIIDYTVERFGVNQSRKYVSSLEKCAGRLAKNEQAREMSELHPEVRFTKCEHHYIFGFPQKDKPFYIVAILHEKMDLTSRIKGRLMG